MRFTILTLFLFFYIPLSAQKGKIKRANVEYQRGNFEQAALLYEEIIEKKDDEIFKVKLGQIYSKLEQWDKAENLYWKLADVQSNHPNSYYPFYLYAMARNQKCDIAKEFALEYKKSNSNTPQLGFIINYCDSIGELYRNSCQDCYELMPTRMNSKGNDIAPILYKNGLVYASDKDWMNNSHWYNLASVYQLYFTRIDTLEGNIYQYVRSRKFKANYLKKGNSVISAVFTPDEKNVYIGRQQIVYDSDKEKIGIFEHRGSDDDKTKLNPMPFNNNNSNYSVVNPCISEDGKLLYFASNMVGGFGGYDIYYSDLMEDGTWSAPVNLGPSINTVSNEIFPYLHEPTNTFYFASDGLFGFGGYDIFSADATDGIIQTPKNLGLPINSDANEYSFSLNADATFGFFASDREEGRGGMDIYSFIKKEAEEK